MPTSTTRKKPSDRQAKAKKNVTSVADWKSKSATGKGVDIELPSGNVAKVKPILITKLVEMDIFPDSLEQIIAEKTKTEDGKETVTAKKPEVEAVKALANPKDLAKLMQSVDRVTAMAVIEPKVLLSIENVEEDPEKPAKWEDIPDDDRYEDALYTDEVDLEDKMFIFQFCVGGTSDLDRFRAEFGANMGTLGNGQGVSGTSV